MSKLLGVCLALGCERRRPRLTLVPIVGLAMVLGLAQVINPCTASALAYSSDELVASSLSTQGVPSIGSEVAAERGFDGAIYPSRAGGWEFVGTNSGSAADAHRICTAALPAYCEIDANLITQEGPSEGPSIWLAAKSVCEEVRGSAAAAMRVANGSADAANGIEYADKSSRKSTIATPCHCFDPNYKIYPVQSSSTTHNGLDISKQCCRSSASPVNGTVNLPLTFFTGPVPDWTQEQRRSYVPHLQDRRAVCPSCCTGGVV